jgi:hypothetical protein
MAPGFVVEHGQVHGALLQEGQRGAALPEGCKGLYSVVAHQDPSVREVHFYGGGFKGEDSAEGLTANLVKHVVRVREGADDDLAGGVGPPAEDHAPTVDRGVPSDDDDSGMSQVMMTTRASPMCPVRKELGTGGHRGRPVSAYSSSTSRMKTAASETAGVKKCQENRGLVVGLRVGTND